jgi:molybdopterin biosynthesis enzyme
MWSLAEARARILGWAEPGEAIEVPLVEALGLVLAEPVLADVDQPPFDRAASDGYAIRAADAGHGWYRLVARRRGQGTGELELGPGTAARVAMGEAMPVGADAVLRDEDSRPEPSAGRPRAVAALRPLPHGANVVPRGQQLRAGTLLAPAGTPVGLSLVGLLAAQGCVYPVCHRRARVAVLAVGDDLVGPGDAPVMHRVRNAAGPAVVAPCVLRGATAHDLGAVAECELDAALDRALTAPVVVVLGTATAAGPIARALHRAGVEPVFSGIALRPGKHLSYGIIPSTSARGGGGPARHHVFHLTPSPSPAAALTIATLLLGPLIARLQGGPAEPDPGAEPRAVLAGPHRATDDRTWAVPVALADDDHGRRVARIVPLGDPDDLLGFVAAEALALLLPHSGPWEGGEVIKIVPLGPGLAGA